MVVLIFQGHKHILGFLKKHQHQNPKFVQNCFYFSQTLTIKVMNSIIQFSVYDIEQGCKTGHGDP